MSTKRPVQLPKFLREEKWGIIKYTMDGVFDLKSLEDLIPADDEEACGTSLLVGQVCHATYADGEDYEATVIFVSENKNECLKQMKELAASKKTTKVTEAGKKQRMKKKSSKSQADDMNFAKKRASENTENQSAPSKKKPNTKKTKSIAVLQLESRQAAAAACAKHVVKGMIDRNVTLVRSPLQPQSSNIVSSPSPTNQPENTSNSISNTSSLSPFEPVSTCTSIASLQNTNVNHTTDSSHNLNASVSSKPSSKTSILSNTVHDYSEIDSPTNTDSLQSNSALLPSIARNNTHAKLDTSANISEAFSFNSGTPNGHCHRIPALAGLDNSSYQDQHNSYLSLLYSQSSPINPASSCTNAQFDLSNTSVQPVMHTLAPSFTQSGFPGMTSAWAVGHPENQTPCNANHTDLPSTAISSQVDPPILPTSLSQSTNYIPSTAISSQVDPPILPTSLSQSTNYIPSTAISSQVDPPILPTSLSQSTNYISMSACNNCTLLNERNRVLASENNILKADIEHLKTKYQEAIKGTCNSDKSNVLETPEYTPSRGYRSTKADYEIVLIGEALEPGKERFGGATSKVVVSSAWLSRMKAKTKKSTMSCRVKRYIDGFFQPWEMQGLNSTLISKMTGDKREIFLALENFASEECGLSASLFNKCLNAKAGTAKRAMHLVFPEKAVPKKDKPQKKKKSGDDLQNAD